MAKTTSPNIICKYIQTNAYIVFGNALISTKKENALKNHVQVYMEFVILTYDRTHKFKHNIILNLTYSFGSLNGRIMMQRQCVYNNYYDFAIAKTVSCETMFFHYNTLLVMNSLLAAPTQNALDYYLT